MIVTGSNELVPKHKTLPRFVYFLMFMSGPWPMLPYLPGQPSWGFKLMLVMAALAPLPALIWLPYNWQFISIVLAVWNILWSVVTLFAIPTGRSLPATTLPLRRIRKALALAVAGLPLAVFLASMEQWLSDLLWSSYYPVNASVDSLSQDLGVVWLNFGFLLFFSALQATKDEEKWTLSGLVTLLLLVCGAHVFVDQLHYLLVTIPLWQVQELDIFPPWLDHSRQVFFLVLWFGSVPLLVQHCHKRIQTGQKFLLTYLLGLASIGMAMIGVAVITGLPINYALLIGQQYEKSGTPHQAIPWYSKALSWSRSDNLKSYLQFRVALLHRKSGRLEESKEAFIRVLVKYYHDSSILLKAQEFRDKLEKKMDPSLKRVVIPGIEARTEYKSAYCVPNSLGLILNYWGDRSGAKRIGAEITQLDRGSLITDEVFYSESRGFSSLVLPLRNLEDVFHLIDHGIPVLAFIPGHVIAIFGYDQVLQTLVTYDVNTYDIWEDQRWSEFSQDWAHMYNTMGIVVPKAKLPLLKEILGESIETKNEAYIQFLMSGLYDEDLERKALHLGRSAGHGFFFADWEYENLIRKRPLPMVNDSVISNFLMGHEVYESQILEYLQSLYLRGDYMHTIGFIERYRKENRLSTGMAILLGGCYYQMGDVDKAGEVLIGYIDLENHEAVTLEFLLKQEFVQNDPETARRISLKLLSSEEKITGTAASLAFWTWRKNTPIDFRNIDESLALIEGYLVKWNPYDQKAIKELLEAFTLKKFRADDEFNQRNWEKKIRSYRNRLATSV
jgi:tetratricopeptide (TPR) repeat protein